MSLRASRAVAGSLLVALGMMAAACDRRSEGTGSPSPDPELARRGNIEVTAKLLEVPEGASLSGRCTTTQPS